jgi:tRNA G26 N,N-dimethylase Trm1
MLALAKTEVEAPIAYYVVDKLCDALNMPVPSIKKVVDALKTRGFQAHLTSFNSKGIKSNASALHVKDTLATLNVDN